MNNLKKLISVLVFIAVLVPTILIAGSTNKVNGANNQGVTDFVTRLYSVCLNRQPDKAGLNAWSNQLVNKQATGISAAYGFVFSNEFQSKNCCNEDYVRYMYNAFFGRQPDAAGFNAWVNALNNGTSRENVFCGFANSVEFGNLCDSYGIVRGYHIEGYDAGKVGQVNLFVERLYNEVLDRSCDNGGMQGWTTQLVTRANSGCEAAYGFVFSDEFINKHLCNAHYLDVLYRAFMGREADSNGKAAWKAQLDNGVTREEVFNGFAGSQEFIRICESYGIDSGSITIPSNGTHATGVCPICGTTATPVPPRPTTPPAPTNTPVPTATPTPAPTATPVPEADVWHYAGSYASGYNAIVGDSHWVNRMQLWCGIMGTTTRWNTCGTSVYPNGTINGVQMTPTYAHMTYLAQMEDDLIAYNSGSRHTAEELATYGITNETRGDYLMMEYVLGRNTYNQWNCPIPDFSTYAGDGTNANVAQPNPTEHYTVPGIGSRATSGSYATSVPSNANGFIKK